MKNFIFLVFISSLVFSCESDSSPKYCTEELRSIVCDIEYENGDPALLDSFKVYLYNQEITLINDYNSVDYRIMRTTGKYLIADDGLGNRIGENTLKVNIVGYISDKTVLQKDLMIGFDGCHVFSETDNPTYKISDEWQGPCTEQFECIPLTIKNSKGDPISLDRYKVTWKGEDITPVKDFTSIDFQLAQKSGVYAIVNDNMRPDLHGKVANVKFEGYLNNTKIVDHYFLVGADRCHVTYLGEEPLELTVK